MPDSSQPSESDHRQAMQAMQAEMRRKISAAKEKRGLVIVHTGNGKGKTTAAFGMLTRMLAHTRRCAVIQFVKSHNDAVARLLQSPLLSWHHVGDGFTWDTQNRAADIASCRAGWKLACDHLQSPDLSFLLLDELNVVLAYDYLPVAEVLEALATRNPNLHVVITGRGAPEALVSAADLVTEMREIKHPFSAGVKAQLGIEF
ncbi:Cob(I)yrinic acid a,c-diamide adenosyltransferase [mine drainage metagenome]|uniref:Cob(I)yrinic acid a,c-diamide adenosyltransferase n=1 Tax=mine drainage metagenome TaxID=410659 RepID=A0A1J5S3N4_9ZZZZ